MIVLRGSLEKHTYHEMMRPYPFVWFETHLLEPNQFLFGRRRK